jgi:hypothetical protein
MTCLSSIDLLSCVQLGKYLRAAINTARNAFMYLKRLCQANMQLQYQKHVSIHLDSHLRSPHYITLACQMPDASGAVHDMLTELYAEIKSIHATHVVLGNQTGIRVVL